MMRNVFIALFSAMISVTALSAEQKSEDTAQAKAAGPAALYSEPIMECLKIRSSLERNCYTQETEGAQIGCILGASKEMGLCFADYGATSVQETALQEAGELAVILQRTTSDLQKWASENEDTVKTLQKNLSPLLEQLFEQPAEDKKETSQNGQEVLNILKLFGQLISGE